MKRKLYEILISFLRADLAGRLDYVTGHHSFFYPYCGPMNGQSARLEIAREIVYLLNPGLIVETGSYRGLTTEWFAAFGIPVLSVEINPRFHEFARLRLANYRNVCLRQGSSADVLQREALTASGAPILFYLDAHWEKHLPLREELEIIFSRVGSAVAMIDDFKVIGDDGYGFDDYGPGRELTIEYLKRSNLPELSIFFPSVPSQQETGGRRGCAVVTADLSIARLLGELPLLTRLRPDLSCKRER